jgi:YHS domain-containing protein
MTTRRFVRRALLAASVSTAAFVQTHDSAVFGYDTSSNAASGVRQTQYQPSQGKAVPNASVSQELNRMFQESGQPMPSMNASDLPNAQGQQSHLVRQKVQPGTVAQQKSQPPKKNFLQKFMGKIGGQDKKAEAAVVPPVPPGYREPAPVPPDNGMVQQTPAQQKGRPAASATGPQGLRPNPPGQAAPRTAQNAGVQNAAKPVSIGRTSPQAGGAQAASTTNSGRPAAGQPASNPQGRVSSAPMIVPAVPGSRTGGQSATAQTNPTRGSRVIQGNVSGQTFIQPGAAPGFMTNQQVTQSGAVQGLRTTPTQQAVPAESGQLPAVEDGFVDPFTDSEGSDVAADTLDLDSLVQPPVPEDDVVMDSSADDSTFGDESDSARAAVATPESELAEPAESNPFTGVTLNEDDERAPAKSQKTEASASTSARDSDPAPASELDETFEGSTHAVKEFGSNLPAIDLPAVDDFESSEPAPTAAKAPLTIPDLNEGTSATSGVDAQDERSSDPSSAQESAGSSRAVDVTETPAAPLQSVDAEKLQQAAEQDRRVRQQRLILSRSGQTGFKGFCPVALRDRRDLVDASPEFTATFGLQTYTFSSQDALIAFEAEPSRYAPAAGGSDVVLLVNSGEEQPGVLEFALWHRDRLYLFRSRETMTLFAQDPQRFASQY